MVPLTASAVVWIVCVIHCPSTTPRLSGWTRVETRLFRTLDKDNIITCVKLSLSKVLGARCSSVVKRSLMRRWDWPFMVDPLSYFSFQPVKERNVLFNDELNTFYLRLYVVRHMVKDHSDSERGNPLSPHGLLFSINSKGSFICTIPQTHIRSGGMYCLVCWAIFI